MNISPAFFLNILHNPGMGIFFCRRQLLWRGNAAFKALGRAKSRAMASGIWRHIHAGWASQPSAVEEAGVKTLSQVDLGLRLCPIPYDCVMLGVWLGLQGLDFLTYVMMLTVPPHWLLMHFIMMHTSLSHCY